MNRPRWWQRRGALSFALLPVGFIYALLDLMIRGLTRKKRAPLPLICVGNLTAGGAGKTPLVQAIVRLLLEKGKRPAVLSRGYGRRSQDILKVDLKIHDAFSVGDEPLIHAQLCPTYVGANRLESAAMAAQDGADILIMDDGLQHHKLIKDLAIEVRAGQNGLGNGFPIPAGPLRQWFGLGVGLVDMTLVVGQDAAIVAKGPERRHTGRPLAAFCGIADPEKFSVTLGDLGLSPQWFRGFPDHHNFTADEVSALLDLRATHDLITTQKDWVRLPKELREQVHVVDYQLSLLEPEKLWQQIDGSLSNT